MNVCNGRPPYPILVFATDPRMTTSPGVPCPGVRVLRAYCVAVGCARSCAAPATAKGIGMAPPHVNYDEAEQRGWTIVRGMFPPELCARLRACVDDAVVATRPLEVSATPQLGMDIDRALELRIPVVDSQSFRHTVRQPIFDSALAEAAVAGNMIEMQQRLYSASDGLRLMQQMQQ